MDCFYFIYHIFNVAGSLILQGNNFDSNVELLSPSSGSKAQTHSSDDVLRLNKYVLEARLHTKSKDANRRKFRLSQGTGVYHESLPDPNQVDSVSKLSQMSNFLFALTKMSTPETHGCLSYRSFCPSLEN